MRRTALVPTPNFLREFASIEYVAGMPKKIEPDPVVGCNVLAQPFFFPEKAWIPAPPDWAPNIVQGKTYDTEQQVGRELWAAVEQVAGALGLWQPDEMKDEPQRETPRYLVKGRLGQGAFRVLVTDAYQRRCAVTGERTLPVLEAAHIKPYASQGPNLTQNGLLLRSDLHKLFDIGYLTVTPEYRVEVSARIKEEYQNGREYYAHHGQRLLILPEAMEEQPSKEFLEWHNQSVFVA